MTLYFYKDVQQLREDRQKREHPVMFLPMPVFDVDKRLRHLRKLHMRGTRDIEAVDRHKKYFGNAVVLKLPFSEQLSTFGIGQKTRCLFRALQAQGRAALQDLKLVSAHTSTGNFILRSYRLNFTCEARRGVPG